MLMLFLDFNVDKLRSVTRHQWKLLLHRYSLLKDDHGRVREAQLANNVLKPLLLAGKHAAYCRFGIK